MAVAHSSPSQERAIFINTSAVVASLAVATVHSTVETLLGSAASEEPDTKAVSRSERYGR